MKLMTLNLWCYFDWENRKQAIIDLINDEQPDIIALQEVQINSAFSDKPQSENLALHCNYPYSHYEVAWKNVELMPWDVNLATRKSHGLALLSKYPIIRTEKYSLTQHPEHDEPCIVLFCDLQVGKNRVTICNVHFGNSDLFSDLHLKELMEYCEKKDIQPIMLGDFNCFNLAKYKSTILSEYILSSDIKTYESMPKNSGTLDYIVIPKEHSMSAVMCAEEYVSDHRAVIAEIML